MHKYRIGDNKSETYDLNHLACDVNVTFIEIVSVEIRG